MPSAIVKTIFFDLDKLAWTITAGGNALLQPLTIGQNDTIDFNVQFIKGGVAQTLTSPTFSAGIKVLNGFSDAFVVQFGAPTGTPPTYTFTATISSTELSAALLTGVQFAIEFRDSTNGIVTLPALTLNIVASYTISGTTPTSANGTLNVAAGKTVTFPQSLTFPSALGTNGFQLTTDGAGALTWAASGSSGITIGTTTANGTAGRVLYTDGALVQQYAISGTGSVAMTNTPTLVTPVLGAATVTSINGIPISGDAGTSGIFMTSLAGAISTSSLGGDIDTSGGGGAITTNGNGSIGLGIAANRTYLVSTAGNNEKTATFPNVTGTVAVAATSATATQALFATATAGAPAYRAIATADIATALTTPGAIGGTTASTGAFTTLTSSSTTDSTTTATGAIQTLGGLGVAKSIFAGGNINIPATTATAGQITQASTRVFHTYGTLNLFVGASSGNFTTTGAGANLGVGSLALSSLTSGIKNVAIGSASLQNVQAGFSNVAIGEAAGNSITSGASNVLIGGNTGQSILSTSNNTAIGFQSMFVATGSSNVAVGVYSGYSMSSGGSNVLLGMHAGRAELGGAAITSGSFNTMLGDQTSAFLATGSYQTAIGAGAICTAINQVMIGRSTESVTLPGGLVTVPVAQTATTAAVSVAVTTTALTTTAPAQAITLANGTNGQIKIITHIASSGGGTAVLTPATSAADYNTITFSSVGDTATLQYHTTGGWYILSLRGAVAA